MGFFAGIFLLFAAGLLAVDLPAVDREAVEREFLGREEEFRDLDFDTDELEGVLRMVSHEKVKTEKISEKIK